MNKLLIYLNQPAPVYRKPWIIVLVSSLLVFFLLGLFQPFGLHSFPDTRKWLIILGFALVTATMTAIVGYVFPRIFKRFYDSANWSHGKSLINNFIILLLIGFGNCLFDWTFTNRPSGSFFSILTSYLLITFLIGLIPGIVSAFIIQNKDLKQNLSDARELNKHMLEKLQNNNQKPQRTGSSVLLSGNTRDEIELYPEDILYLEAAGNYVIINYKTEADLVKQKQLRTTIGQMEQTLQPFPFLVKCHRAFIVNTSYIINIEGNSQGFLLSLSSTKTMVPVSRSYTKTFREIMV